MKVEQETERLQNYAGPGIVKLAITNWDRFFDASAEMLAL